MAELPSLPESRALARLKELHRADQGPPDFRRRVAARLTQLEAPVPRRGLAWRRGIGLLLLAAAAAVVLLARGDRTWVRLQPEQPAAARSTAIVSLSGIAVPGSLRWHGTAARDGSNQLDCQYRFAIAPEGGVAAIRVRWARCGFPAELREHTQPRSSAASGPLRVVVAGRWSAPGQLEATELRVVSRATEP